MNEPAGSHTVRQHNRGLVLHAISSAPGSSRADIAALTGLARATVSAQVDELIASGLVAEDAPVRPVRGRPASPLLLNSRGPAAVGIEINVGYLAVCVIDLNGDIRAQTLTPVNHQNISPQQAIAQASTQVHNLLAQTGLSAAGAALALPALITNNGVPHRIPHLPQWSDVAIIEELARMLQLPIVTISNEANLSALAEHRFNHAPDDFILLSGEVGIGGGIIINGQPFVGVHGFAGELGHMSVHPSGPPCQCGAHGCLEQYAGVTAIVTAAQVADFDELLFAANAGHPLTAAALREAGQAMGIVLASVINTLDIPTVILGGHFAPLAHYLTPAIAAQLTTRVASGIPVTLQPATLGPPAAMLGAAGTVRDAIMAGTLLNESVVTL